MKRFTVILILLLTALVAGQPAFAQNTKRQENRKAKLQKEINIINDQLKTNAAKSRNALSSLDLVRKQISLRKSLISESDREIDSLSRAIATKERQISALEGRLDTLQTLYGNLVLKAYKTRDEKIWYMYILSSEDLGQAWRRASYLKGFSKAMSRQAKQVRAVRDTLSWERDSLETLKVAAGQIRAQRVSDVNSLKAEETSAEKLVSSLNGERARYEKQLAAKRREVEALNREIAEIIRKATAGSSSKKSGSKSTSSTVDEKLSGEFAANKGRLPWPVDGTVIDSFGERNHPVFKNVKLPFNNGVTVATPVAAPVKAVFDGTVAQVVVMPGYNKCVLVRHGKYFTFYCRLGSVSVSSGDKVKTGQVIGTVDTIGDETSLHFQLWSGREPQNPENWLK